MKRLEIEKKLKKELDKERYTHTIGVMYTAAALAMAHHADVEQAMYAGLLHDCAKCISNKKKLKLCKKYRNSISINVVFIKRYSNSYIFSPLAQF